MEQINLLSNYTIGVAPSAAMDGSWLLQMYTAEGTIQVKIDRVILESLAIDVIQKMSIYDKLNREANT